MREWEKVMRVDTYNGKSCPFLCKIGKEEADIQAWLVYTDQAANTFHGENISCNACYHAFSNELQMVLPVESAAGYLVSAQVWRVIFNKSEHRKFVLVLLQYLCTAACKAVNVKGNTW